MQNSYCIYSNVTCTFYQMKRFQRLLKRHMLHHSQIIPIEHETKTALARAPPIRGVRYSHCCQEMATEYILLHYVGLVALATFCVWLEPVCVIAAPHEVHMVMQRFHYESPRQTRVILHAEDTCITSFLCAQGLWPWVAQSEAIFGCLSTRKSFHVSNAHFEHQLADALKGVPNPFLM